MPDLSRTERYMARVSEHLPTLADDEARRDFLVGQLAKFEEDYARFIATKGESVPAATAFDFVETIAALTIELSKVSEHKRIDATALKAGVGHLIETLESM